MLRAGPEQTWHQRPAALAHLLAVEDAGSVEQCRHCGRWYLSVLETPRDEPGDCGTGKCLKIRAKRATPRRDHTSDYNYHGAHRDGTL